MFYNSVAVLCCAARLGADGDRARPTAARAPMSRTASPHGSPRPVVSPGIRLCGTASRIARGRCPLRTGQAAGSPWMQSRIGEARTRSDLARHAGRVGVHGRAWSWSVLGVKTTVGAHGPATGMRAIRQQGNDTGPRPTGRPPGSARDFLLRVRG